MTTLELTFWIFAGVALFCAVALMVICGMASWADRHQPGRDWPNTREEQESQRALCRGRKERRADSGAFVARLLATGAMRRIW